MAKRNALGKGLGALIEGYDSEAGKSIKVNALIDIPVEKIEANPFQPRVSFDEESLEDLAASMKKLGVIQPLTLRYTEDERLQLIAGERRLKAAKIAGLETVPAYIRTANDQGMLEMALVENIQREDLDAIEIAISYQRLLEECKLTQEQLSERIGKQRSTISNYIRLLRLPPEVQLGIREHKISMGHARALINLEDTDTQIMVFKQILRYDFPVRKVEEVVRQLNANNEDKTAKAKTKKAPASPDEYQSLEKHLSGYFHTPVKFTRNTKGKGRIVIPFDDDDQLERIIAALDKLDK